MKICQNCGHENSDTGKFCGECGAKLVEAPKFCPECGAKLEGTPKFCPECGHSLVAGAADAVDDESEENSYDSDDEDNGFLDIVSQVFESDDSNDEDAYDSDEYLGDDKDYEEYVDEDDYEDEETTEEKIRKIVDKYIDVISKDNPWLRSTGMQDHENAQWVQNIRQHIAKNKKQSELYGFVDVTVFGKGKAGLLFTNDALYLKEVGGSFELPYYRMASGMYIKGGSLYFYNTEGCGKGLLNLSEVDVSGISYNLPALKDCLEEILAII